MPKLQRFKIVENIEKGNYATIHRVSDGKTELILKISNEGILEYNEIIRREYQILSQFCHPNIVRVYEYDVTDDHRAFFTLEYIKGRPITKIFSDFSEDFILAIIQVINALGAFHNKGFIHGDLKPEHIIYNEKEKKAVLIDFGFAGLPTNKIKEYGTIGYVAPEVLKGIGMDQRSDLYSLGVIIYEILTKNRPVMPYKPIKNIPELINNTIAQLLAEEPNLRPTAPELYEVFRRFIPEEKIIIPPYEVYLPITAFIELPEIMERISRLKGETLVLIGELGSGKTRWLKELRYRYLFKDYDVLHYSGKEGISFHKSLWEFIQCKEVNFADREEQFQIYAETTERLLEFAKDKNIVLLVDDIDELSDYELGLFRFIGHSIKDTTITIIGTTTFGSRIKELEFSDAYLRPFAITEIERLIDNTFFKIETGNSSGRQFFIEWLFKNSGGNPLFIVEILKTLYEQKILYYTKDTWVVDIDLLKKFTIPERIEEIISARVSKLDEGAMNLMKILALAEEPLPAKIINQVMPAANIYIEVLKNTGLARDEYLRHKRFFYVANQIVKKVVEQRIAKPEKESIIKNLTKAIEDVKEEDLYPALGRLYDMIAEKRKASEYFLLSAKNAEEINDHKQAIEYYKKALDLTKEINPEKYFELSLIIGELNLKIGENGQALEYFNKALGEPKFKKDGLYGQARAYSNIGDYDKAVLILRPILAGVGDKKEFISIANRLGYCLSCKGEYEEAREILNQSLKTAEEIGDYEKRAEAIYYCATIEWFNNSVEKGIEMVETLLEFCKTHHLHKQYAYGANLLGSFYIQKGDVEKGLEYIEVAIKSFESMKLMNTTVSGYNNKALLLEQIGNIKNALEDYHNALENALKIGNKKNQYVAITGIADILAQLGHFEQAIEFYKKALIIEPASIFANYGLSMVYYKLGALDKAKEILEEKIKNNEATLYYIGLGIIYGFMGRMGKADYYIKQSLNKAEKEVDITIRLEAYLKAGIFYYEKGDYENSLDYAEKVVKLALGKGREYRIAESLIKINQFRVKRTDTIDIEGHLEWLKEREFLYDYAYLKRLKYESMIDQGVGSGAIRDIAEGLDRIEKIFKRINAEIELKRVQKLQLGLYPVMVKDYSRATIAHQYLDTLSKIAELISSNLDKEDFIENVLDLVIERTGAERGGIFIVTEKGMEFVAGRNLDKTTLKDAAELSRSAIEEVNKNRIVFVPNAIEDSRFNIRKSVILNQIRSILCIPLITGANVIGAIYLDSRLIGSLFKEQDRDFLRTVSMILAAVIERSIEFKDLIQENILLKNKIIGEIGEGYLLSRSKKMKKIYEILNDIAQSDAPVLITGETGTGKGMLARMIHLKSKRKDKKFLSINCGGIPETLLESELFGHKKGAFTGAFTDKKGLLEEGEGGTIFLDEITNTSPAFQAKMLEAIEEKVIRRVGDTQTRKIGVRFILATNKEIEVEVEEGRFRKDLYFRINVFRIDIPPLRERPGDIPELAGFFLKRYCKELNKDIQGFGPGVMERLKEHQWEGNIRELENMIERGVTLAKGRFITLEDLGLTPKKLAFIPFNELKKEAIIEALNTAGGNKKIAAKILGISRRALYYNLKKYSIK